MATIKDKAARKPRFPRATLEGVQVVLSSFSEDLAVSEAGSRLRLTSLRWGTVLLALDRRGLWAALRRRPSSNCIAGGGA